MVDDRVVLLADVAVLLLQDLAILELVGWEDVRSREHRPSAKRANARPGEHPIVPLGASRFALAHDGLHHPPARPCVGVVDEGSRLAEAPSIFSGHGGEHSPVSNDELERLGGGTDTVEECGVSAVMGGRDDGRRHKDQA
jgi:hypothetical protein